LETQADWERRARQQPELPDRQGTRELQARWRQPDSKPNYPTDKAPENSRPAGGSRNSDSDTDHKANCKANSDTDRKANRKADRKPTDMGETGPEEDGTSASTSATPIDQDAQDTSKGAVMATPLLGG